MTTDKNERQMWALCLTAGQMLLAISSFFWNDTGRYSVNGSVLILFSQLFWAVGFIGLFGLFKQKNPWYARLGLLYAFYGCMGGFGFGYEGLYSMIFDAGEKIGVAAHERFPLQMNLALYWAGPAFPLTLLVLGAMWLVRKPGPWWVGLLFIAGGVAFPVSRILRTEWIAHLADLLLLIPVLMVAGQWLREQSHDQALQS